MKDIKAYIADIERQIKPLIDNKILQKALVTNAFKVVVYVDSLDWKDYGADSIIQKCTENKKLGKGSIILMHNGAKYTPEALERVITGLKDKGYYSYIIWAEKIIITGGIKMANKKEVDIIYSYIVNGISMQNLAQSYGWKHGEIKSVIRNNGFNRNATGKWSGEDFGGYAKGKKNTLGYTITKDMIWDYVNNYDVARYSFTDYLTAIKSKQEHDRQQSQQQAEQQRIQQQEQIRLQNERNEQERLRELAQRQQEEARRRQAEHERQQEESARQQKEAKKQADLKANKHIEYMNTAQKLLDQGRFREAIDYANKSVELKRMIGCEYILGVAYALLGENMWAIEHLNNSIKGNFNVSLCCYYRQMCNVAGRQDKYLGTVDQYNDLNVAYRGNINLGEYKYVYATYLVNILGDYETAYPMLNEGILNGFLSGQYLGARGRIHEYYGRINEAALDFSLAGKSGINQYNWKAAKYFYKMGGNEVINAAAHIKALITGFSQNYPPKKYDPSLGIPICTGEYIDDLEIYYTLLQMASSEEKSTSNSFDYTRAAQRWEAFLQGKMSFSYMAEISEHPLYGKAGDNYYYQSGNEMVKKISN